MTLNAERPQGLSIGYILKRLWLALLGYLVAIVLGLVAMVAIYSLLSLLPNPPLHVTAAALSPIAMLFLPPVWIFVLTLALVCTIFPALVWIVLSEVFAIRRFWLHMIVGAGASLIGYTALAPAPDSPAEIATSVDLGVIACAGLIGGLVYWLIAGRDAGFRRYYR